ncbi:hypothetical protein FSPOR_1177 [Fusarium sporotrichioides]|uniref:Uncharacterized protein n=1 Tax=Fusarium sporotrichioides TaxID=5514 RepID=A0A395SQ65_FUSSP|nr:hypothetical protein FSPOR_1177 [Fusarium sporotrichioides]
MAAYKESPGGEIETDTTFQGLKTAAQRSAALRIHRLAGKFPWEIVDFCTETRWDIKLLDKFAALIHTCFAGKLSSPDAKRLQTTIFEKIKLNPIRKRMCLLQSDIQEAQHELRRSVLQQTPLEDHGGTSTPTPPSISAAASNKTKRPLTTSESSEPKRARAEKEEEDVESAPAFATRSSRRLRSDSTDVTPAKEPKHPANIRDPSKKQESAVDSGKEEQLQQDDGEKDENGSQEQNKQENGEPEVAGKPEDTLDQAHGKDSSTEHHNVEELIVDAGPLSKDQTSKAPQPSPARKALVAHLSMTDKEIADRFRKNISFIACRRQFTNDKRLKELKTEYERCTQELQEAQDLRASRNNQKAQSFSVYNKALEELKKSTFRLEKTGAALAPYQELENAGSSVTQIFDMLKAALEDAKSDYQRTREYYMTYKSRADTAIEELDEAESSVTRIHARRQELAHLMDLEQNFSAERNFQCNIRMATDARNEDGHLFGDLTFCLEAVVRQQENGTDSD